jgi:hypothetical protein
MPSSGLQWQSHIASCRENRHSTADLIRRLLKFKAPIHCSNAHSARLGLHEVSLHSPLRLALFSHARLHSRVFSLPAPGRSTPSGCPPPSAPTTTRSRPTSRMRPSPALRPSTSRSPKTPSSPSVHSTTQLPARYEAKTPSSNSLPRSGPTRHAIWPGNTSRATETPFARCSLRNWATL